MKKIISLLSAVTMLASFAANFSVFAETTYTEPTLYFEVEGSTEDLKAGDKVIITGKYAAFDVSPYDDAETGNGEVLDSYQLKITLPGTIATKLADSYAEGEEIPLFKRGGSSIALNTAGSAATNLTVGNDYIVGGAYGCTDLMTPDATLFTATLVLLRDPTGPLTFEIDTTFTNQVTYKSFVEWEQNGGTVFYNTTGNDGTNMLTLGEGATLGEAAATKYAVTVSGGTADVTEAEEGQTVTVTADVPAGKVIGSIDASVDYTDNENGTYTFKMPAEAVTFTINYVDEVVEFEATAAKSATKYYTGVAEDVKEIQVFDVTVANSSLAKWIFTFASASASDSRTFTPDMSSFGDATVEFDAWIVGAPADVTLTVE